MRSVVERAVATYIRAASERDPSTRAALLEACFAADGRLVTRSREFRGRAAVAEVFTRFLSDPDVLNVRVVSAVDAGETTFRFQSVVERRDGTRLEFFDAGEVDSAGQIAVVFTFSGPLAQRAGQPERAVD